MNIGIIGCGVVGGACKYGFEKIGHNVNVHDIRLGTSLDIVKNVEICYICVPTPSLEDGGCDVSIVEDVVDSLIRIGYMGIIVIKSTVKPGTTERLRAKTGREICFVPEFLRERSAATDFIEHHDLLAIGTHSTECFDAIKLCHGKYPQNIARISPTEAELLKYYSNVFNALRVTFANVMYEVCKSLGADYSKVKDTFILRKTTTDMYMDVNENFRGFGGVCLPKDTAALAALVKELNLDIELFNTIQNENKKFKPTVFKGMRL